MTSSVTGSAACFVAFFATGGVLEQFRPYHSAHRPFIPLLSYLIENHGACRSAPLRIVGLPKQIIAGAEGLAGATE
jgi:hypothetical protein